MSVENGVIAPTVANPVDNRSSALAASLIRSLVTKSAIVPPPAARLPRRLDQEVGQLVDPILRDAGDIDATVVDHVDAVLRLQLFDHVLRQPEQREHARV